MTTMTKVMTKILVGAWANEISTAKTIASCQMRMREVVQMAHEEVDPPDSNSTCPLDRPFKQVRL